MLQWPLRARKIVQTPEHFASLFQEGGEFAGFRVDVGLPAGAKLETAYYDQEHEHLVYIFTHPSWELAYSLLECPYQEVFYTTTGRALRWPMRARLVSAGPRQAANLLAFGLPPGAELAGVYFRPETGRWVFVLAHGSWEEAESAQTCLSVETRGEWTVG